LWLSGPSPRCVLQHLCCAPPLSVRRVLHSAERCPLPLMGFQRSPLCRTSAGMAPRASHCCGAPSSDSGHAASSPAPAVLTTSADLASPSVGLRKRRPRRLWGSCRFTAAPSQVLPIPDMLTPSGGFPSPPPGSASHSSQQADFCFTVVPSPLVVGLLCRLSAIRRRVSTVLSDSAFVAFRDLRVLR